VPAWRCSARRRGGPATSGLPPVRRFRGRRVGGRQPAFFPRRKWVRPGPGPDALGRPLGVRAHDGLPGITLACARVPRRPPAFARPRRRQSACPIPRPPGTVPAAGKPGDPAPSYTITPRNPPGRQRAYKPQHPRPASGRDDPTAVAPCRALATIRLLPTTRSTPRPCRGSAWLASSTPGHGAPLAARITFFAVARPNSVAPPGCHRGGPPPRSHTVFSNSFTNLPSWRCVSATADKVQRVAMGGWPLAVGRPVPKQSQDHVAAPRTGHQAPPSACRSSAT